MNLCRSGSLQPGLCSRRPPASRAADRRASSVSNKREFRSAVFPSWLPPTRLCDFFFFFTPASSGLKRHASVPVGTFTINVIKGDFFQDFFKFEAAVFLKTDLVISFFILRLFSFSFNLRRLSFHVV